MEELREKMLRMIEDGEIPMNAKMRVENAKTIEKLNELLEKYSPKQEREEVLAFQEYVNAYNAYNMWSRELANLDESHDVFGAISEAANTSNERSYYEKCMEEQIEIMNSVREVASEYAKFLGNDVYRRYF